MERRNPDPGSGPIDRRTVPPARSAAEVAEEVARFVPDAVLLVGRLLTHPAVPMRAKVIMGAAIGYVIAPIDLIPDRIPVLGYVDDVIVAAAAADVLITSVDDDVVEAVWQGSEDGLDLLRASTAWSADLLRGALSGRIGSVPVQ